MMLTVFCVFLCVPNGLSEIFESTRGKLPSTVSPLPPPPSSPSSSSSSSLSLFSQSKSPLLTSANNWYPTSLVLTTTAPPNASNIDDWADQQADPTVAAETRTSNSGSDLHDELCSPDANLNGNSLEERNKTAIRVAANCRTAVLQKPNVVKFYGDKINPSTSAFKSERRNLSNNFISPHSINAKTSPNGEITVINGKSVTGILYAHQHSLTVPQFEKLTAPGKNYIVTKTGNEDTAASENKTDHADNDEGEESDEGEEKDGKNEEKTVDKNDEHKNETTEKALNAGSPNNKNNSEKDSNDEEDADEVADNGDKNQYSHAHPSPPPSPPPPSPTSSITPTYFSTSAVPPSPPPYSSTSTAKTSPASTTTSTTTTRPAKIRFPPRRPDYISKAKYGDKLDKQTAGNALSTTTTTSPSTARPRLRPYESGTRRPMSFLAVTSTTTTTTDAYPRHRTAVPAFEVPTKKPSANSQIEALRNRYKSNVKVNGQRLQSPPSAAVPPTATPNKVTVEYTTTTTTTTESLLKYELEDQQHNSSPDLKGQKQGNGEAGKVSKNTAGYLNNEQRKKQFREKERDKIEHDLSTTYPSGDTPPNVPSHNAASAADPPPTDTTKKQIPEPNNVRQHQKETYSRHNMMATTARPRGLNRWTNYHRHPSTTPPTYRYVSSTSSSSSPSTPYPIKMSLPQNAYYYSTAVPATGEQAHQYFSSQSPSVVPDSGHHQSFLPAHFEQNFRHQDFAQSVSQTPPPRQWHSTEPSPPHLPDSASEYHFSNYFVQSQPQEKLHSQFQSHSLPATTSSPEVFVTIENQFIVLRNQTPTMQKEILLPPFPENHHHQQQHQQNKFNNALFDLPFGRKEHQFKVKQQPESENSAKPFTASNYNVHNYNQMANHPHGDNNRHLRAPVTLSQLSPTKNPAEMVFYYEQGNQPKLNYKLAHSPGNQEEPVQTPDSSLSLFDQLNILNRPLSNTIPLSRPTMMPTSQKHPFPKMNMFKPIDITPNKAMPIVFNEHMSSTKKLNHAVRPGLSMPSSAPEAAPPPPPLQKGKHPGHEKVKSTSVSYLLSPLKSGTVPSPFKSSHADSSDGDSEYTVVRHYVRTIDYDDSSNHHNNNRNLRPSTLEFDSHLNFANLKENSQMLSNVPPPSASSLSQYFGQPRHKSQIILNDDNGKAEQYHRSLRMIEPTVIATPARPTQAIVFNFNSAPPGSASHRQQQPPPQKAQSYSVNLRDVSLLTNLKRPTPSQQTLSLKAVPLHHHHHHHPQQHSLPMIASKPTSNPDISALFMPDSDVLYEAVQPNIVPVETTIFESEPSLQGNENLVLSENTVNKGPLFSVDSAQAKNYRLPFQTYSGRPNRALLGRQQHELELQTPKLQKSPGSDVLYSKQKLKQSVPQDVMDEGSAESKIHELMKPSADPFEEYYSDRILPLNAMIDYSGVVWNAENGAAESNRVNLLHPNTTQGPSSRPPLPSSDQAGETAKPTVKSKLKDLLSMLNEVRTGNQSQQQHLNNRIKSESTLESEPLESGTAMFEQTQLVPVFSNTVENDNLQNDAPQEQGEVGKHFEGSMSTSVQQANGQSQPLRFWHLKPSVSPSEVQSTAQPSTDFRFRRNQRILNNLKTIFGMSNQQISLPVLNNAARLYS